MSDVTAEPLTLFYAPYSRALGVRVLLEELGAEYQLKVLNLRAGEQRQSEYLAINPMGKVPAIWDRGALVSEQVALCIYLADRFPQAGLAPALNDPLRGPYLRWIAFYGSCFEPALMDRAAKHAPASASSSPYGDYETMLGTLTAQLAHGPYLLGERLTAADFLWGIALDWTTQFGLVPKLPVIADYIKRIGSRPIVQRLQEEDSRLAQSQAASLT